jgi:hypothetical protein
MQAIVSAKCMRDGHKLHACFLFIFCFSNSGTGHVLRDGTYVAMRENGRVRCGAFPF